MKKKPRTTELERTAYHEAGHAVAALVLHTGLKKVTIVPDEGRGSLGTTGHGAIFRGESETRISLDGADPECSSAVRRLVERQLVMKMAGYAAESIFSGRRNNIGAVGDFKNAYELASRISFSEDEANCLIDWALQRAKGLLRNGPRWKCVAAVARALLAEKTLSRKKVESVYWEALGALVGPPPVAVLKENADGSRTWIIAPADPAK